MSHDPALGGSEIAEVDIVDVGRFPRSQLQELWTAVNDEAHFRLDSYPSLPDLVSMSTTQLRQIQSALFELCDDTGLADGSRVGSTYIGASLQKWRINESTFKSLPHARQGQECAICCQIIAEHSAVALPCSKLGCASHFHVCCIRPWLERRPDCPLCRADVKHLALQRDPGGHRLAQVGRRAATRAQTMARLCHIQKEQILRLSGPSVPGSMIVGLFTSSGPSVISTGDYLNWLRSKDFLKDDDRPNTGADSASAEESARLAQGEYPSSSHGIMTRWRQPVSAGFRAGVADVRPHGSRSSSRKPQTVLSSSAGMQLQHSQSTPIHRDFQSRSDTFLSQTRSRDRSVQDRLMVAAPLKRKPQSSPSSTHAIAHDRRPALLDRRSSSLSNLGTRDAAQITTTL